jgi:glyoxylase-like metal-dependent hydrolase (beta-lactamase superfamily II)
VNGERWLFAGDAVFYGGVPGIINAHGSDMSGYPPDLSKLAKLAVDGLFPSRGLFTMRNGQRHIDEALRRTAKAFMPRQAKTT